MLVKLRSVDVLLLPVHLFISCSSQTINSAPSLAGHISSSARTTAVLSSVAGTHRKRVFASQQLKRVSHWYTQRVTCLISIFFFRLYSDKVPYKLVITIFNQENEYILHKKTAGHQRLHMSVKHDITRPFSLFGNNQWFIKSNSKKVERRVVEGLASGVGIVNHCESLSSAGRISRPLDLVTGTLTVYKRYCYWSRPRMYIVPTLFAFTLVNQVLRTQIYSLKSHRLTVSEKTVFQEHSNVV